MKQFLILIVFAIGVTQLFAQLSAGPMLGYKDFLEAHIWIQTEKSGEYAIQYWEKDATANKTQTEWLSAKEYTANTITFTLDNLQEGRAYVYEIKNKQKWSSEQFSFSTPALWRNRRQPDAFTLALGSSNYTNDSKHDQPGEPYGTANTEIFKHIAHHNPDMMLWLGDNIYLREPDFGSRTAIYRRYGLMRKDPNLKDLLANTSNIAVWDDTDFGPNDATGAYPYKIHTLQAFKDFWANPSYGINEQKGITSMLQLHDALFFVLDNRYNRGNLYDSSRATLLGNTQLQWLKDALYAAPKNDLKFILNGGQWLNSSKKFGHYINLAPLERQEVLDFICDKKIKNVYILSGDKHHSEVNEYSCSTGVTITEFTVSPLTAKSHPLDVDENNIHLVKPYFYDKGQNFGILKVEGDYGKRKVSMHIFDKSNVLQYSYHKAN